jgi:hypothetical protein
VCKASLIETQKILLHLNSTSKITEEFQPGTLRWQKTFWKRGGSSIMILKQGISVWNTTGKIYNQQTDKQTTHISD